MLSWIRENFRTRLACFENEYRKFAKMRGFKSFNDFAYYINVWFL